MVTVFRHLPDCAIVTTHHLTCTCGSFWRGDVEDVPLEDYLGVFTSTDSPPAGPTITATKHAAYVPMSTEMAMDAGLLTEEEARARGWTPAPAPPPIPWRTRARWRWQSWRERAGRKVGRWIAGVDLSEREDDD